MTFNRWEGGRQKGSGFRATLGRFHVPMNRIGLSFFLGAGVLAAQGNYEIQVYPSETQDPGTTMIELHSNFTFQGSKGITNGVLGTEHQEHETVEITQGINPCFGMGFYFFT